MSKFKYQERSEETVSRRANQSSGDYDNILKPTYPRFKPTEGENTVRILPPTWDTKGPFGDNWAIDIYQHWDIGADSTSYLCLDKMREKYGEEIVPAKLGNCPICAARAEGDMDEETAKELKPSRGLLALIIDRDNEKDGPQVWSPGVGLETDVQFRSKDKKTGAILPIDHPDRGYDITFRRKGTGKTTKYDNIDIDRDYSYLHDKETTQDKWLDFIMDHPLPECLNFFDEEYISKVFSGKKSRKTEDDDRPSRSSRGERSRRDSEPDEEEDRRDRRSRDSKDEESDSRSSRRGSRDEEERGSRRGREEESDSRSSRRSRDSDEEPDTRDRGRSRRGSEDEAPSGRERSRGIPETSVDEDEIPSERSRRAAPKDDGEDKDEAGERSTARTAGRQERTRPAARSADRDSDGEEEPEDEGKSTTEKARGRLERLRPKR